MSVAISCCLTELKPSETLSRDFTLHHAVFIMGGSHQNERTIIWMLRQTAACIRAWPLLEVLEGVAQPS